MRNVIGYRWSVWFKSSCLKQSKVVYEDEDDAAENAKSYLCRYLDQRKEDGCNDGETEDMFDIETSEVLGEETEDVGIDVFP